jgi:hypothetical protein
MYAQFRSQFPMGSLLSELLQIHEGKYVVRASIQVGGSTLATGLSAAHSIEQAEDQARSRALVVLGIEEETAQAQPPLSQPYPTQVHFMPAEPEELPPRTQSRLSAAPADFLPAGDAAFQRALEVDWDAAPQNFPSPEQQLSWLDSEHSAQLRDYSLSPKMPLQAPSAPSAQASSSRKPSAPSRRSSSPTPDVGPSSASPSSPESAMAAPLDLSDVIAQTDVELKRLGWTHVQGRRYLEKTYQKRSRQHLTDAELIEFLDYLSAQPANGMAMR